MRNMIKSHIESNINDEVQSNGSQAVKANCVCCWDFQKLGTMTTGIIIFLSAGTNLSQGFGRAYIEQDYFRFSWFIGVSLGTCLSLILRLFWFEKYIMALSSLLILIEGIIYVGSNNDFHNVLTARYMNGIAVGLATLTFLIHASEISLKAHRGILLGTEHYAMAVGICVQMIYSTNWNTYPAIRLHGILDIVLGIIAFASTWIFIESPFKYLRKGDDARAMECLNRLHHSQSWRVTTDIIFNDLKDYVHEEMDLSWWTCFKQGALPLLKMLFFRSMMLAFSFSLPLFTVLQYSTTIIWSQIFAACLRVVGCYLSYRLVDNFGRKLPSLISAAAMGTLILSIAFVCYSELNVFNSYKKLFGALLTLATQFFAGLFAPITSVYMAEAFPLKIKPYFMAICIITEKLIHVIVICTYGGIKENIILLAEGILILATFLAFCVTMPETKKLPLRAAQKLFRNLINLQIYEHY